ncbi:unnamed protein product [Durusdinium trenchii]|uniref:Uncharacterized protein n=1 Tax=Durusdinium trenchii TaxID=1381693 RepID=A0ABP0Q6A8_9DINO
MSDVVASERETFQIRAVDSERLRSSMHWFSCNRFRRLPWKSSRVQLHGSRLKRLRRSQHVHLDPSSKDRFRRLPSPQQNLGDKITWPFWHKVMQRRPGGANSDSSTFVCQEDLSAKRSLRRSWTTSMSQAGKLVSAILRPFEDGDTPGNSTVVSAAASEVASDSDTPSLKPSPRESKDIKAKSKVSRITFEGSAPLDTLEKQESDSEEEELPQGIRRLRVGSDASSVGRKSDTSSVNWRADALDVGENLAAEAAAKKGHTSIDSIVALVEAERERWDEEKQALEAKLEELKDHLRSMQAQLSPDAEKQALKAQYQELRKAMKARSRFGAWVCERHMIESDDEEPNAEREELRNKISELSTRLRQAKASLGAASSESDVSPSRRSPGIMRHKK